MKRPKIGTKPTTRFALLKRLAGLLAQKAPLKQYYLEIGVHLLKKGVGYHVGQIIDERRLHGDVYKVKVITGLYYDFKENKVNHTIEKKIVKAKDVLTVEKGR